MKHFKGYLITQVLYSFFTISLYCKPSLAKLVKYELRISFIEGYPDGVHANYIIGINGQFPGPTLEANVGDTLEIKVINDLQDGQNTSLHWHGLHQKGFIFEDGVSMITQCPLAAGHTQIYRFNLTQAGTYWYHSHFKSQYTSGLFGALIAHPQKEAYDYYGEATLMLSDWYHRPAHLNEEWYLTQEAFGQPPQIDSSLINGMGQYGCPAALLQNLTCRSRKQMRPVVRISRGKTYRLRVINASSRTTYNFSIAETTILAFEADGIDVAKPVISHVAPIAPGQRYSFLLRCPENSRNGSRYLIRAINARPGSLEGEGIVNINKFAHAAYTNATGILECIDSDLGLFKEKSKVYPELNSWLGHDDLPLTSTQPGPLTLNEMDLQPHDQIPAPEPVDEEYLIRLTFREREEDDVREPNINYTAFTYPDDKPLLHKVIAGENLTTQMISIDIQLGNVVQLIINNEFAGPHPFHLHGHHFYVVGMGIDKEGNYDSRRHNLTRFGVKRDTLLVPDKSWAAIRFLADNPGVWLFHCHQDWHAVGGMALVFNEGVDFLRKEVSPTNESLRVCDLHNNKLNI